MQASFTAPTFCYLKVFEWDNYSIISKIKCLIFVSELPVYLSKFDFDKYSVNWRMYT